MEALTAVDNNIPQELIDIDRWVLHKNKIPYQVNGVRADSTDPNTWASYEEVMKHVHRFSGIGYVLTEEEPYTVIDLDDCIVKGELKPEVRSLVDTFDSYTEYSQSGNGLHIFIKGKKPGTRSKNTEKGIEIYDNQRFIVMTGNHYEGTPHAINERQDLLNYVYDTYFTSSPKKLERNVATIGNVSPSLSDIDVITKAAASKSGVKFKKLYSGDFTDYGSQSEADQALCNMIAFYTQDAAQVDRIFSNSGLYRDKWDRQDYKANTIQTAISGLNATYQKSKAQDFQLHVNQEKKSLKSQLFSRRKEELEKMQQDWELSGSQGRKPTVISPLRCAIILMEHTEFVLFDLEEHTRVAMYQPEEGIYTRNVTIMKRVISWLEPKLNNTKADEVIYHLTNRADVKEPTVSRYLIPVNNGIFNLKTKKLEPFSPDYIFTTKISTSYRDYVKKPIIDGWDIDKWLSSIACGDKEIVKLLWQVISDSLNGNYSRKKAIFLVGDGNNGKGTFQELIINLIGLNNVASLKINEFEERFRLSVIEGKTAVIGDDVPANVYVDDSSNFNSVATGDVVSVEFKNRQPYSTRFRCSVIQSTNGMPKFRNKTEGTIRRVLIVPFNADFNGEKENFKIKNEYIKDEKVLQYVLHKAIRLDFEKFDEPAASKRELEIFKQDNDPVLDFKLSVFDEWNIPEVPKGIVYEFYKIFCSGNGFKPLSNRSFHTQFKKVLGRGWEDSGNRFRYDELMPYLGDLDKIGIGFPDEKKYQKTYKLQPSN